MEHDNSSPAGEPSPARGEPVEPRASRDAHPSTSSGRTGEAEKPKSGWLNLLIDWAPVLTFFAVYRYYAPGDPNDAIAVIGAALRATGAFIVAAIIALVLSKAVLGRISRMLALSTVLIVGFGALTIFLADPFWIQIKPTAFYVFFGAVLLAGWYKGKALLQWALEAAFEGLTDEGWLKLSRNWGLFFFVLAAVNEGLRYFFNVENGKFGVWVDAKLWLFLPLSFVFTFTQIPMLLRHGLSTGEEAKVIENPPTE